MAVHARELVEAFDGAGKQRFGTAPMDSPLGRFCALFLEVRARTGGCPTGRSDAGTGVGRHGTRCHCPASVVIAGD